MPIKGAQFPSMSLLCGFFNITEGAVSDTPAPACNQWLDRNLPSSRSRIRSQPHLQRRNRPPHPPREENRPKRCCSRREGRMLRAKSRPRSAKNARTSRPPPRQSRRRSGGRERVPVQTQVARAPTHWSGRYSWCIRNVHSHAESTLKSSGKRAVGSYSLIRWYRCCMRHWSSQMVLS